MAFVAVFFFLAWHAVVGAQPRRPILSTEAASAFDMGRVFSRGGDVQSPSWSPWAPDLHRWDPRNAPALTPHYLVGGSNSPDLPAFPTLQAAINRAVVDIELGAQSSQLVVIGISPGQYSGLTYIPRVSSSLLILGLGKSPDDVVFAEGTSAGMSGEQYRRLLNSSGTSSPSNDGADPRIACADRSQIGTGCSAVMWIRGHGVELRNLTIANTYQAKIGQPGGQAVALLADGTDRLHLNKVGLFGHQDTLYLRASAPHQISRTLVRDSVIEGDVDFIFGSGTAYFLSSEIRWNGANRGLSKGWVAAPSTHVTVPYGFVFDDCDFTSVAGAEPVVDSVYLARQWFQGAACSPYGANKAGCLVEADGKTVGSRRLGRASIEAVGKMVVLRSRLGPHLKVSTPWAPWQTDPGHSAYRPVQYGMADFEKNLFDFQGLFLQAPTAHQIENNEVMSIFLAEFKNLELIANTSDGRARSFRENAERAHE